MCVCACACVRVCPSAADFCSTRLVVTVFVAAIDFPTSLIVADFHSGWTDGRTDGRTDRQTHAQRFIFVSPQQSGKALEHI